jgi:hypothetical protein
VVESSPVEVERTRSYLTAHVPARPLGQRYIVLPCLMDGLLKLYDEVSPHPVGFIHYVGSGATQTLPRVGLCPLVPGATAGTWLTVNLTLTHPVAFGASLTMRRLSRSPLGATAFTSGACHPYGKIGNGGANEQSSHRDW